MEITKKMLEDLRPEIEDALKEVAQKYGITMRLGNGHYGGLEGDFKLLLRGTGNNGETKESEDFKRYATGFGLRPEWVGELITDGKYYYTISTIYPRKRKMPVGVIRDDNDRRIMSETQVRMLMKRQGWDITYYSGDNLVAMKVGAK